jgi:prephenate dehydrogenase
MRIAIIGVGLIGGSVALAARARLDAEVAGFDRDPEALRTALDRGALDVVAGNIAEAMQGAEAAFVAAPVGILPELVAEVLASAPERCVVSDVGSTKRALAPAHQDQRFVGGHPLAGAETAGIAHARADLFDGATWYLTPAATTSGILYERLHRLIAGIGARPVAIEPDAHDVLMATVSHLPHVLANVLVQQAAATLQAGGERLPQVGPSFRDATRVAGANTAIWTDIYLSNRDALIDQIDGTVQRLQAVRETLAAADPGVLASWNDAAAESRRALNEAGTQAGELHELRVAVPNRPGVVAELALALGRGGVNITDLALYPAADMNDGVVALWIAGADSADRAELTLKTLDFQVFRP